MAVSSVRDVVACFDAGQFRMAQPVRKAMAISWTNGYWADTTMFAGQPGPQYYASAPLVFAPMARSTHGGWDHGPNVAPLKKHLKRIDMTYLGFSASGFITDVLGYVPFVDESAVGEEQVVDNSQVKAPRHGTGTGVRLYLVSVAPSSLVAGNTVTVTYTNSDGVAGRSTGPVVIQNTQVANGALLNAGQASHQGPFLPLQSGDAGVREIESIRVDGPGDVGLFTVVMARVLCNLPCYPGVAGADTAVRCAAETDFLRTVAVLPLIEDDAYLSCLMQHFNTSSASTSLAALYFNFDVIWG